MGAGEGVLGRFGAGPRWRSVCSDGRGVGLCSVGGSAVSLGVNMGEVQRIMAYRFDRGRGHELRFEVEGARSGWSRRP